MRRFFYFIDLLTRAPIAVGPWVAPRLKRCDSSLTRFPSRLRTEAEACFHIALILVMKTRKQVLRLLVHMQSAGRGTKLGALHGQRHGRLEASGLFEREHQHYNRCSVESARQFDSAAGPEHGESRDRSHYPIHQGCQQCRFQEAVLMIARVDCRLGKLYLQEVVEETLPGGSLQ